MGLDKEEGKGREGSGNVTGKDRVWSLYFTVTPPPTWEGKQRLRRGG